MISGLGRPKQALPWDSLASQLSLVSKLQASERDPISKRKRANPGWMAPDKEHSRWPLHTLRPPLPCTLTLAHTRTRGLLSTHIKKIPLQKCWCGSEKPTTCRFQGICIPCLLHPVLPLYKSVTNTDVFSLLGCASRSAISLCFGAGWLFHRA